MDFMQIKPSGRGKQAAEWGCAENSFVANFSAQKKVPALGE
jgi:hypothetical protein